MLNHNGDSLRDKTVAISGSGNVAIYAAEKSCQLGAKVVTLSDSGGMIYDPDGLNEEKLSFVKNLKEVRRGRIAEYAEHFACEFHEGRRPWDVPCEVAMPCATQNELDGDDAKRLLSNGCTVVVEGANMPCTLDGAHQFLEAKILYGAVQGRQRRRRGSVPVSNSLRTPLRISWSREEVDARLRDIMQTIHERCVQLRR